MNRLRSGILLLLVLISAAVLVLCVRGLVVDLSLHSFLRGERQLNVLLITLDTTRWDHLGCFGSLYTRTPGIDFYGKGGVRFSQTLAPAPLTLPSHTTIMTGTYPIFHGVRNNGTFRVPERNVTLAEVLKERGYATAAVISSFVLDHRFGLDQGFDYYNDELKNQSPRLEFFFEEIPAAEVSRLGIEWLKNHHQERFFLWLHYYDPHAVYQPPQPYARLYGPANLYDGEIAYMDEQIGKVTETLTRLHLLENTLVVLCGDHGESLGDHGEPSHGLLMYDPTMRVPLIFYLKDRLPRGKEIKDLVRLVDVMPTILHILDLPIPENVQGQSLLPRMFGARRGTRHLAAFLENYLPYFNFGYSQIQGLRTEDYLYIMSPEPELYDLRKDPRQYRNLHDLKPKLAGKLAARFEEVKAALAGPEAYKFDQLEMDEQTKDKLRALGYVWADTPPGGKQKQQEQQERKDPKRMLKYMTAMNRVAEMIREEQYPAALSLLEQILTKDPTNRMALLKQAYIYVRMGNVQDAIATYQRIIQAVPDYLAAHLKLADLFIGQRNFEAAVKEIKFVLDQDPGYVQAWSDLGACYFSMNDYAQAEQALRRGLTINPDYAYAHYNLAAVLGETGRLIEAEQEFQEAIRHHPGDPDFHLGLAKVYELQGRKEEAEKARQTAEELAKNGAGN